MGRFRKNSIAWLRKKWEHRKISEVGFFIVYGMTIVLLTLLQVKKGGCADDSSEKLLGIIVAILSYGEKKLYLHNEYCRFLHSGQFLWP